jgi:hypothetical protein
MEDGLMVLVMVGIKMALFGNEVLSIVSFEGLGSHD